MWKLLAAALIGCCFFANAQSQPVKAVDDDAAKVCHDCPCKSKQANYVNTAPSNSLVPESLRVEDPSPLEKNHGYNHQQKAGEIDAPSKKKEVDSSAVAPDWTAIASGAGSIISAVMAGVLAILGFYSWRTSKAAVEIASKSHETAQELAAKQARAYVYITKVDMQYSVLEESGPNPVYVSLKNYGHTPAQINAFKFTVIEGTQRHESLTDDSSTHIILGPGEGATILARFRITTSTEIEAGHTPLLLIFRADYQDMDGVTHHVQEPFMFGDYSNKYGFAPYEGSEERSRS